jgi:hypothetical protein
MKLPFLPYRIQERAFRKWLAKYTGKTAREIRRDQEEDNEFVFQQMTFTEAQEVWDAAWAACEDAIERAKK